MNDRDHRLRNILCFGDSNTWGYTPGSGARYPWDTRWPGVLQRQLGSEFRVIEEGLNGRTTVTEEKLREHRSGLGLFATLLESHAPLSFILVMLGSNDLKADFNLSPAAIADGARQLCVTALESEFLEIDPKDIILISPSRVGTVPESEQAEFDQAIEKSARLAHHYQTVAEGLGIGFVDAAQVVNPSAIDGVHWDAPDHLRFGNALAAMIRAPQAKQAGILGQV